MELDLGAVRTFIAVVDDGHFTDAADHLGMTQQAVSKRIARLESDLGAPLSPRYQPRPRPGARGGGNRGPSPVPSRVTPAV